MTEYFKSLVFDYMYSLLNRTQIVRVMRFSDYQVMNDMDNVLSAVEDHVLTFEANGNAPPLSR